MFSREKVDAVYDLREAVEQKVRAEVEVEAHPSQRARDVLLDATLNVESRTQHAIEVCHACGLAHAEETAACPDETNVINVDFGKGSEGAPG
jgi:hypothetical protein